MVLPGVCKLTREELNPDRIPPVPHYPPNEAGSKAPVPGVRQRSSEVTVVAAESVRQFEHLAVQASHAPTTSERAAWLLNHNFSMRFVNDRCESAWCLRSTHGRDTEDQDDVCESESKERRHNESIEALQNDARQPASQLYCCSYALKAYKALDVALLKTCRSINTDAAPLFYSGTNFVFETELQHAMHFLKTLPDQYLRKINTISLPLCTLTDDDTIRYPAWPAEFN